MKDHISLADLVSREDTPVKNLILHLNSCFSFHLKCWVLAGFLKVLC